MNGVHRRESLYLQLSNSELVQFDTAKHPSYISLQKSISNLVSKIRAPIFDSSGLSLNNALSSDGKLECYTPKESGLFVNAYKILIFHDSYLRLRCHILMIYTPPELHHLRNPSLKWTIKEPTQFRISEDIGSDHHDILNIGQEVFWVNLPGNDRLLVEESTVPASKF